MEENWTPTFSGVPDADKQFLLYLNDKDVLAACDVDKYARSLCDDDFWRRKIFHLIGTDSKGVLRGGGMKKLYLQLSRRKDNAERIEWVAKNGNLDLFILLLPTNRNKFYYYHLEYAAAKYGQVGILEYLIIYYPSDLAVLMAIAAENGQLQIMMLLFDYGADGDFINALDRAASYGQLEAIKYLINVGADVHNSKTLERAAKNGFLNIVRYLLNHGANATDNSSNAFVSAAEHGQMEVVKYLLDQGADLHAQDNVALIAAAMSGNVELVEFFLDKGLRIEPFYQDVYDEFANEEAKEFIDRYLEGDEDSVSGSSSDLE